jgi:hypothetical protein
MPTTCNRHWGRCQLWKREAQQRKIDLAILPTDEAIKTLQENFAETNAILHVTC